MFKLTCGIFLFSWQILVYKHQNVEFKCLCNKKLKQIIILLLKENEVPTVWGLK